MGDARSGWSGVSVKYEILHGALKFDFIEPDDQTVREAWETQLSTYGELLQVAITILAATLEDSKVALLRLALARWKEAVGAPGSKSHAHNYHPVRDRSRRCHDAVMQQEGLNYDRRGLCEKKHRADWRE